MCGYVDQRSHEYGSNVHLFGLDKALKIDRATYGDDFRPSNNYIETGVGGIGDYFLIHSRSIDGDYYKCWSKFGMKLPLYPGKEITYFNAKIEKLEEYHQGLTATGNISNFGKIAINDFLSRPCVIFVNSFFEADKKYNTGYYKIERKDGQYIPLAGFFGTADYEAMETSMGHCLVTRTPYPSIEKIGHHRSPVILDYDRIDDWLDADATFLEKLEIVSQVDNKEYDIQMVDKKSVTRRLPEARHVLVEGVKYSGTLIESEPVD